MTNKQMTKETRFFRKNLVSPMMLWQHFSTALGWTKSSYVLMSGFVAILFVIGVVWWPLARDALAYVDWSRSLWLQVDWLLLFDFAVMSLLQELLYQRCLWVVLALLIFRPLSGARPANTMIQTAPIPFITLPASSNS